MIAAHPLEQVTVPLWRRGAKERTRARRRNTLDEATQAGRTNWRIFFMSPLHRSRIRWFVRSLAACLAKLPGRLPVHSIGLTGLLRATLKPRLSRTQLSPTHTLMSYAETIFEDLRSPKELKISTPFLARNRKKTAPTLDFQKTKRVRTPPPGAQDFDSAG